MTLMPTHKSKQIQTNVEDVSSQSKVKKFAKKGFIRLATGKKVKIKIPPRFHGKPLGEYLKEIRE